jgi:hypothetical protein
MYDWGVFGGNGIGCRGARGVGGGAPDLGDMGGEAKDCFGNLGNGDPSGLSPGLGLVGRPGLIRGDDPALLCAIIELSELVGLRRAFNELAGGWRGESGSPACNGLNWRGESDPTTD